MRIRPLRLLVSWVTAAAAVALAAAILPGFALEQSGAAFAVAAAIALLNAVVPPLLAALRLPFMLVAGFLLVLAADALLLQLAGDLLPDDVRVDSFGDALLAALVISAVGLVLQTILGTNDDDAYTLRVTRRIARRQGAGAPTDVPGIVFLEIDGLALPILRDAMRDGSAPNMARWIAEDGYRLAEWEPDLSSQTGASQAGILLGSNENIPAFRWVEKETGRMIACSSPADCAELERRLATGQRTARERRHQPREPALGRGRGDDPHRQPRRRRAPGQPGIPGVPCQRLQCHAGPRPLRLGGRARTDGRRAGRASATSAPVATAVSSTRSCGRRCA